MKVFSVVSLVLILLLVANDVAFRFDQERVELKRQNQSAQRHWSLFYPQVYTYTDSPFKYQHDMQNIGELIEPNYVVLTDKATSYYVAAELAVYVKNVHAHHYRESDWNRILGGFYLCYIDQKESFAKVQLFIDKQRERTKSENLPEFKYWLVNRDPQNLNLRSDCLATRGTAIAQNLKDWAKLIYQGEYLWLYEIN